MSARPAEKRWNFRGKTTEVPCGAVPAQEFDLNPKPQNRILIYFTLSDYRQIESSRESSYGVSGIAIPVPVPAPVADAHFSPACNPSCENLVNAPRQRETLGKYVLGRANAPSPTNDRYEFHTPVWNGTDEKGGRSQNTGRAAASCAVAPSRAAKASASSGPGHS